MYKTIRLTINIQLETIHIGLKAGHRITLYSMLPSLSISGGNERAFVTANQGDPVFI